MKRILISQNERHQEADYLIIDGILIVDTEKAAEYKSVLAETENWREVYCDKFLKVKKYKKQLLLCSRYVDKNSVGRSINYFYILDGISDYNIALQFLESDSQIINKKFNRRKTLELINKIKSNEVVKRRVVLAILLILTVSVTLYEYSKV